MSDQHIFRLSWRNGEIQDVTGPDIASAMNQAGLGLGPLGALEQWEKLEPQAGLPTADDVRGILK